MDPKTKKWLLIGGGVAAVGALGWWWWNGRAQAAAMATATAPALPPASSPSQALAPSLSPTDQGSDYSDESYDNPYGLSPEELASYSSSVPSGVVMRMQPPARSSRGSGRGTPHPISYAQWYAHLSAAERAWVNRLTLAQRHNAYQTGYVIPFEHGRYGGPHGLAGLGYRRHRFAHQQDNGDDASGGGYYDALVYDPDID